MSGLEMVECKACGAVLLHAFAHSGLCAQTPEREDCPFKTPPDWQWCVAVFGNGRGFRCRPIAADLRMVGRPTGLL
jgi:hypothetical protein